MAESLFSPHWYRFAESTPRLLAGVTVRHQHYRDEAWYVLLSTTTSRQYRINRRAYQFIGRCDGHLTVEHIWDDLLETMQDEAPTQEEIIGLLTRLAEEGLVDYGATPNFSGQRGRLRRPLRQFTPPGGQHAVLALACAAGVRRHAAGEPARCLHARQLAVDLLVRGAPEIADGAVEAPRQFVAGRRLLQERGENGVGQRHGASVAREKILCT